MFVGPSVREHVLIDCDFGLSNRSFMQIVHFPEVRFAHESDFKVIAIAVGKLMS